MKLNHGLYLYDAATGVNVVDVWRSDGGMVCESCVADLFEWLAFRHVHIPMCTATPIMAPDMRSRYRCTRCGATGVGPKDWMSGDPITWSDRPTT